MPGPPDIFVTPNRDNDDTLMVTAASAHPSVDISDSLSDTLPAQANVGSSDNESILGHRFGDVMAENDKRKVMATDHSKRLEYLRKIANGLEKTEWMYEPIHKLLG